MNQDLATFFTEFSIPETAKLEKTFLEIAQQPHYENVLSNIYAFYFREEEEHGLHDLFLSTLKTLITEKIEGKNFEAFDNPHVQTEKHTTKGGFIDILLHNTNGAIIIENKVHHHIKGNNLDDYWNSVPANSDEHKVGIILSMYPIAESQYAHNRKSAKHYINITHLELMNRVMEQAESYWGEATPKFKVFLEDFYQNIKNQSQSSMNENDLKFYLEHRTPIHKAATLKYRFKDYVKTEAARANALLDINLELNKSHHKERLVYYVSKKNPELMLTLVFEELFQAKNKLHLFVELTKSAKLKLQNHPELYQGKDKTNVFRLNGFASSKTTWAHYAYEHLRLENEELVNLSQTIAKRINASPLLEIFMKLEDVLSKTKEA